MKKEERESPPSDRFFFHNAQGLAHKAEKQAGVGRKLYVLCPNKLNSHVSMNLI